MNTTLKIVNNNNHAQLAIDPISGGEYSLSNYEDTVGINISSANMSGS